MVILPIILLLYIVLNTSQQGIQTAASQSLGTELELGMKQHMLALISRLVLAFTLSIREMFCVLNEPK